jgi:hypothetical protein
MCVLTTKRREVMNEIMEETKGRDKRTKALKHLELHVVAS